jgi:hypothetical protein
VGTRMLLTGMIASVLDGATRDPVVRGVFTG